jgi:hypothetical protein
LRPEILKQKEFTDINKIKNNPKLFDYLTNDDIEQLVKL